MTTHPTLAELDQVRTAEAPSAIRAHVAECAECRAKLEKLTQLTARLTSALPEIVPPLNGFPPEQEMLIRQEIMAKCHAIRIRRARSIFVWKAVAAVVVVAFVVIIFWSFCKPRDTEDFNRDGSVDVIDAYLLARKLDNAGAERLLTKIVCVNP